MHAEVKRRLVHASGAVFPLAYVAGHDVGLVTWTQFRLFVVVASLVTLAVEILRLTGRIQWTIFETLTREYEREYLAGYALYVFSSAAVVLAFSPEVAVPAVLILMLADPVSGLLGSGERRAVKRGHVLFVMFAVSTLIAILFVPPIPAVCGGLAATIADGVKPVIAGYVIDDNLTIPPAAALAMLAALEFL